MIAEPWALVCALGQALGLKNLREQFPGQCWTHQLDEAWWFALNPHGTPCEAKPPDWNIATVVNPFDVLVTYNGWPAGMFGPSGGLIAAGEGANVFTFAAALRMAIADRLPSGVCMFCHCTEHEACEGGCTWVERNLCSSCAEVRHVG